MNAFDPSGRVFTLPERLFSGRAGRVPRDRHERRVTCSAYARRETADGVLRGARPGDRAQIASRDRPAVGVGEPEPGDAPSGAPVLDDDGLPTPAEDPLVGPLPERRQHGQQRLALLGQAVRETLAFAADVHALEDAVIDQVLEPGGEDVLGDAEAALEVAEAAGAEERVADDEQRPPVPEGLEGLPDPAVHVGETRPPHAGSIAPEDGCIKQPNQLPTVRMSEGIVGEDTAVAGKAAPGDAEWKSTACI